MIKSEVKSNNNKDKTKFPILMINKDCGNIVLFTNSSTGLTLVKPSNNLDLLSNDVANIGDYSESYNINGFVPFNGEVTLSNI